MGLIYLITGLVRVQITWMRVIVVVIGVLVALLALWGVFMWGVSQQYALVALSAVLLFVGIALSIGALVWPAKWGRLR